MSWICEGKCTENEYCQECAGDKLRIAKAKLEIAVEALEKIKYENLDDKTTNRYIVSLTNWRDKACRISWQALEKIKEK